MEFGRCNLAIKYVLEAQFIFNNTMFVDMKYQNQNYLQKIIFEN